MSVKSMTGIAQTKSSAYLVMHVEGLRGCKDPMWAANKKGAITDPWGTPDVTIVVEVRDV